jgi:gamma-glutamylcyclotransferase (GGCT)/AIG2-like uncharacterized protein YtfP
MTDGPMMVLATYGTLQPGEINHHELAGLAGTWISGHVRGRLRQDGWGSAYGFPGLTLDPEGDVIPVKLFRSADLPAHWPRLDEFEGEGYRRVAVTIDTEEGVETACIYVLAGD